MYHWFVERRVKTIFEHLNRGDFDFVLAQFAPGAEHWFSGHHALSGVRTAPASRAAWYQRLKAVLPGLRFALREVVVAGPPWNTRVTVEWADQVFDLQGQEIEPNRGVFVITLRWGRAVRFHVYCDTDGLARNLAHIAEQGQAQAAMPPIVDAAA